MAEAARREAWEHTSSLMALVANANRDPKRKPTPFKPADFNPYALRRSSGLPLTADTIGVLRQVFVPDSGRFDEAHRRRSKS